MTTLLEASRLALEALTKLNASPHLEDCEGAFDDEIAALRQAIEQAQQAEPIGASEETQRFAIQIEKLLCEKLGRKWSPSGISIQTLVDELADRQAQQAEPFCYVYIENGEEFFAPKGAYVPDHAKPLYTSPPPRQPLTAAQAGALWKVGMTPHDFAQAIEAVHGIGEKA